MITASKRHLKVVIISLAFGLCACGLVDGIKHKAFDWLISKEEIVEMEPTTKEDPRIPKYPSYDWDYDEAKLLAMIAANTNGTDYEKQQAVILCLNTVWGTHGKINITEYFNEIFDCDPEIKEPTEADYLIVQMVIDGICCPG